MPHGAHLDVQIGFGRPTGTRYTLTPNIPLLAPSARPESEQIAD